jgi:hypothetical protein
MSLEVLLSLLIGVGLAAASGFRVFGPLLLVSAAARAGFLDLNDTFAWMASNAALVALAAATVAEAAGYLIPGLDHAIDVIATPAAVTAGAVLAASVVVDLPPFVVWSLAIIGAGTAGAVQASSVVARGASTLTTAGLANPLVGLTELVGSILVSLISILAPFAVAVVLIVLLIAILRFRRDKPSPGGMQ